MKLVMLFLFFIVCSIAQARSRDVSSITYQLNASYLDDRKILAVLENVRAEFPSVEVALNRQGALRRIWDLEFTGVGDDPKYAIDLTIRLFYTGGLISIETARQRLEQLQCSQALSVL